MTQQAAGDTPHNVPDGDDLALLMRCYGYRVTRAGTMTGDPTPPTPAELAEAGRRGWRPRHTEQLSARAFIARAIAAAQALRRDDVAAAFIAGVGGSAPRGRLTLISYAWAIHLPQALEASAPALPDCGLSDPVEIDVADELVRLALGSVWNEVPEHYLPDLEAAASHGLPTPTAEDTTRFRDLLAIIAVQPPEMTPGALEKEIARRKIVPRSDKYQRYGILQALAEAGVMPNPDLAPSLDRQVTRAEFHRDHALAQSAPRSDIVPPLANWRGAMGIDRQRLRALFGISL